jgi:hypothetical protein
MQGSDRDQKPSGIKMGPSYSLVVEPPHSNAKLDEEGFYRRSLPISELSNLRAVIADIDSNCSPGSPAA